MPSIPLTNKQVRERAFSSSGFQVTPKTVGDLSGTLKAAQGLVGEADKIYQEKQRRDAAKQKLIQQERDKAERIELDAFETKARDLRNRMTHDRQGGFLTLRGKNTTKSVDTYNEQFDSHLQGMIDELGNDSLKSKAALIRDKYKSEFNKTINEHTFKEMERYDDEQTEANLASLKQDAVLNYQTAAPAAAVQRAKQLISGVKDEKGNVIQAGYAQRKGMSRAEEKSMLLGATTEIHSGVINQLLNNKQEKEAKLYLEKVKKMKEIDADTIIKLEEALNVAEVENASIRVVDGIMGRIESGELTEAQAKAQIRQQFGTDKADERDESIRRLDARMEEYKDIQAQNRAEKLEKLKTQIDQYNSLDQIPPSEKAQMSKEHLKRLQEYAKLRPKGGPTTDPVIYNRLREMAANPALQKSFLREDPFKYFTKLDDQDYNEILDLRAGLLKGDKKTQEKITKIASDTQVIRGVMSKLNISSDKAKGSFQLAVIKEANDYMRKNNLKEISNEDLEDIAYGLGRKVDVAWSFSDKRVHELTQEDKIDYPSEFIDAVSKKLGRSIDLKNDKDRLMTRKYYLNYIKNLDKRR